MNGNLKHFNSGQGDLSPAAELQIIFSFPALLQSLKTHSCVLTANVVCAPRVMNISPTFYYLPTDHAFSVRASYYVTMTCYRTLITAECWEAGPGHPGLVSTFVQKATFHWYTIIWYKQHFTRMFFVLCLFIQLSTVMSSVSLSSS